MVLDLESQGNGAGFRSGIIEETASDIRPQTWGNFPMVRGTPKEWNPPKKEP